MDEEVQIDILVATHVMHEAVQMDVSFMCEASDELAVIPPVCAETSPGTHLRGELTALG